ncbi:transmembrane repetitive protein [Lysobacter arvi]|uniref:Transmembrane repetitive protein n=1 Tax=Lysobacter arvi TaxID=3038776 RepID=A0ABU1CC33_9GAMM|nr:transmembrane repetitive protein [Lysobacter arvi]MDR0181730.1 transmembrane repetitive protein [Lysobacter arvi]
MFSAADLIHALQRRLQLVAPHLRRKPGEFPPGWQAWFDGMARQVGAVRGATVDAIIAVFLQRPLAERPRRTRDLTRWQAFTTLMRQDWSRETDRWDKYDRRTHWFAATFTIFWHVFFSALLLYLMYLRFMAVSAPAPQGEDVTMIEYIGTGTPKEPGGGAAEPTEQVDAAPAPAQPAPSEPAAAASPAPQLASVPEPALPTPTIEAPLPDVAQRDVPEPQLPPPTPPPVEQPVTVSEPVPNVPEVFVLPPTRRAPPQPTLAAPELRTPVPQVRTTEVAEPVQPTRPEIAPREIAVPTIEQRTREITMREVPVPTPRVPLPTLPEPGVPTPQVRAAEPTVRTRDVPTPPTPATTPATTPAAAPPAPSSSAAATAPASSPTASTAPSSTPSTAPSNAPAATSAPTTAAPGTAPAATGQGTQPATAGAGPSPTPAPGTWSTPRRGDDWGDSTRNAPGGQRGLTPGLYNSDGSLRVPEPTGSASPNQPPGAITQEIRDLDRSGTWLKRKPTDFEPTSFDKYWVPDETLLAEWVRKGIQKVTIPIPGTNKRIECVVSMLGLGGGCGLSDPNLNDQPAEARPPPDIPFKPALQEDNGSIKP